MSVLKALSVAKSYGGRRVVNGVNLVVQSGEVVGLLGPNGAGKTTTFHMMVGLVQPDEGHVLLNEDDLTQAPIYQRARAGISYLPQESSVFRRLTVEQNLLAILQTLDLSSADQKERGAGLMKMLGVSHLATHKAFTLSGGERRHLDEHRRRDHHGWHARMLQNSFSIWPTSRSLSTWKNFAQLLVMENSSGLPMNLPRLLGRKNSRSLEK